MPQMPINYKNALKYYAGKADAYPCAPNDSKAYNTLNVLFYADTTSERARIREGKKLNTAFITNDPIIITLCRDLIKSTIFGGDGAGSQTVYRIARLADVDAMIEHGQTLAFTSTSQNGFLDAYSDKDSIVLLEFILPPNAPRADLVKLIPDFAKPEEAEVLLPPWLPVELEQCELSEAERKIKDHNGAPPAAKYRVKAGNALKPPEITSGWSEDMPSAEPGKRVLEALMRGNMVSPSDESAYTFWKTQLLMRIVKLSFFWSLPEIFTASMESVRYITGNVIPDVFDAKSDRAWIQSLLGIDDKSDLSNRINDLPDERVVHTITTFLLGSWLREGLFLGFNKLPRIFSKNNRVGDPFPFFWTVTCLGHDIGYKYENEKSFELFQKLHDDNSADFAELKALLKLSSEKSLLELNRDDLLFYGLDESERDWAENAIQLAKRYYRHRLDPGGRNFNPTWSGDSRAFAEKYPGCIDHGIIGGMVMFDVLRNMAVKRNPLAAVSRQGQPGDIGVVAANYKHSRFLACGILVSLSIARHNMWVVDQNKPNDASSNPLDYYQSAGLSALIVNGDNNKIRFDEPLDQLLYFLDYMDTIDPVKAFYLRSLKNCPKDTHSWKEYLKNNIYIGFNRGQNDDPHQIRFRFLPVHRDSPINPDETIKGFFKFGIEPMKNWLVLNDPPVAADAQIDMYLPKIARRCCSVYAFGVTKQEILDICFYQGVPDSSRPGAFYCLPNAYQTFNLLMMDGLAGEQIRIGSEMQSPDSIYIRNWEKTVEVFKNVFTAQCKCLAGFKEGMTLYRMDRKLNADQMQNNQRTIAFTSATKTSILPAFLKGKVNPVIETLHFTEPIPLFDYQAIMGDDYAFANEEEVLLPPFVHLKTIQDSEGSLSIPGYETAIPQYVLHFGGMRFPTVNNEASVRQTLQSLRDSAAETLERFVSDRACAKAATEKTCADYYKWKCAFQSLIGLSFQEIYNKIYNKYSTD